jgi:hypothetical protein
MAFHPIADGALAHLPKGGWRQLAEEYQSRLLRKAPFNWGIESVKLLPLADVRWGAEDDKCLASSFGSGWLAPIEVANYLYYHQDQIPTSWRGKDILFWTVFENCEPDEYHPCGNRFACALTYAAGTGRWMRLYVPVLSEWTERDMIAVLH